MSYNIRFKLPAARGEPERSGAPTLEQIDRLERVLALLHAQEPCADIESGEHTHTIFSERYGDVLVDIDQVELGFSMRAEPELIYRAIHELSGLLRAEGLLAFDPQLGASVESRATYADFMRQYRSQYLCTDIEFEAFIANLGSENRRDQEGILMRGEAVGEAAFPRDFERLDWQAQNALDDDALWTHAQRIASTNDRTIAENDLTEFMRICSDAQEQFGFRRVDGSYLSTSDWVTASTLRYEADMVRRLQERGFAAVVFDQPQRLTLVFEHAEPFGTSDERERQCAISRQLLEALERERPPIRYLDMSREQTHQIEFRGADVERMHAIAVPLISASGYAGSLHVLKRYGDVGAREERVDQTV
ncbi:MAG: hypothetical protein ABIW82_09445 [Dokdonella sp.]